MTGHARKRVVALVSYAVLAGVSVTGCGRQDLERNPRPPVPVYLSGVITEDRITVAPHRAGAGPIVINIQNQTQQSHTVTLEGTGVVERVGPINPFDTAQLQKNLTQGTYTVRAGSPRPAAPITPATVLIGPAGPSAKDKTQLP